MAEAMNPTHQSVVRAFAFGMSVDMPEGKRPMVKPPALPTLRSMRKAYWSSVLTEFQGGAHVAPAKILFANSTNK